MTLFGLGRRGPKSEEARRLMSLSHRGASQHSGLSGLRPPATIAEGPSGCPPRYAEALSNACARCLQEVFRVRKKRNVSA
jgi:hypothetical protein